MKNNKTLRIIYKILLCLFPFILVGGLMWFVYYVTANFTEYPSWLPGCWLYDLSKLFYKPGIICPVCGATRSVFALVKGDILLSLRQNLMVIPFAVYFILLYLEYTLSVFGVKVKKVFRNGWFISILIIVAIIYSVIRNFVPVLAPIPM